MPMRRICFILLVTALATPVAASASGRASGDGSLAVTGASGTLVIKGRGVIFGHFDQGALIVLDYTADDSFGSTSPTVTAAKSKVVRTGGTYAGTDVRFLFPAGRYTIEFVGLNIDISAVGKGFVSVTGAGTLDDGTIAINGGKPQPVLKAAPAEWFGGLSANFAGAGAGASSGKGT